MASGKYGKKSGGSKSPYDYTDGPVETSVPDEPAEITISNTGRFLTPESIANMRLLVSKGNTVDVAATATGAAGRYKHWAENARRHKEEGREAGFGPGQSADLAWLEAMNEAKAVAEATGVMVISEASKYDWKAAAWLLERRASNRWHLQAKLELTAKSGDKLEISSMSTEALMRLARQQFGEDQIRETRALPSGQIAEGEIVSGPGEKKR